MVSIFIDQEDLPGFDVSPCDMMDDSATIQACCSERETYFPFVSMSSTLCRDLLIKGPFSDVTN
jgi:hypothetical protein